jgi:hypothetical protein
MTTHLELLRTIVTHTVHEPPPSKHLFGEEAIQWARAFAFSRPNVSGERIGVRLDGVAAAMKLARSLAKDNPHYQRGARYRTITEAILNASMEIFTARAPDTIAAADLAELKAAVSAWFSQNIIPRCHVVPCVLIRTFLPISAASIAISIGEPKASDGSTSFKVSSRADDAGG